jgi:hypothetical protein
MPVWDEATDVLTSGKTSVVEVIDEDVVSTLNISVVKKSTLRIGSLVTPYNYPLV